MPEVAQAPESIQQVAEIISVEVENANKGNEEQQRSIAKPAKVVLSHAPSWSAMLMKQWWPISM